MYRRISLLILIAAALISSGCSKEKEITDVNYPQVTYIGSAACQTCHPANFSGYDLTGHNFILTKVNGAAPDYPDMVPPLAGPPVGYTWNDISYVVGGFGWKALFVDDNGYLITGSAVQFNLATGAWSDYMSGAAPGTVPYDCAGCHATGVVFGPDHQGDLPGISGEWAEDGVGCERCHGPAGEHALDPADVRMTVDYGSALCGECHSRNGGQAISAQFGLILNYSQYDEISGAGHANVACASCHDPHRSAVYDPINAIETACTDCHNNITVTHTGPDECYLCHMPLSVISAVSTGSGVHLSGDVRSHIFAINTDTTQAQFYMDGNDSYSNGFNGLNFSCLSSCHSTENLQWAATNAASIHQ